MTDDEDEVSYGLVMPFMCVTSNGGTLDDHAFVAGYRCGEIAAKLSTRPAIHQVMVEPDIVQQLDLIAMHHGFTLTTEPTEVDGWVEAKFTLAGPVGMHHDRR